MRRDLAGPWVSSSQPAGTGSPRGARGCGAGSPPTLRPSAPLRGAERGRGALRYADRGPSRPGDPAGPGRQRLHLRVRGGRVSARTLRKSKDKKFWRPGASRAFISKLFSLSPDRDVPSPARSVIPLPAVVSISSWPQLICCDSCPRPSPCPRRPPHLPPAPISHTSIYPRICAPPV